MSETKDVEFKILPEHFRKVTFGVKTFEHRTDIKGIAIGDTMILREIVSLEDKRYTGYQVTAIATLIYKLPTDGYIIGFKKKYSEFNNKETKS